MTLYVPELVDPQTVIYLYQQAYRAANGKEPPALKYELGWYAFPQSAQRHRRAQIEAMTQTLMRRAEAARLLRGSQHG